MGREAALLTPCWNCSTSLLGSSRFRPSDGNCERPRHVVRCAPDAGERSGVHQHSALGVVVTCGVATTTRCASYACCDCDVDGVLCRSKIPPAPPRSPQARIPGPRPPRIGHPRQTKQTSGVSAPTNQTKRRLLRHKAGHSATLHLVWDLDDMWCCFQLSIATNAPHTQTCRAGQAIGEEDNACTWTEQNRQGHNTWKSKKTLLFKVTRLAHANPKSDGTSDHVPKAQCARPLEVSSKEMHWSRNLMADATATVQEEPEVEAAGSIVSSRVPWFSMEGNCWEF